MSITGTKFTKELTLDIYSADLQVVTAQQGDKLSRYVKINILANGEPMEFASGISASLQGHRADWQVVNDKCKIEGNSIIVELTDAMLAVAGDGEYKIVFYGTNGSALSTVPFKIHVAKNPFDETAVVATPIFSALTDALNQVNKAITDTEKVVKDSTEKIEEMDELKDDLSDMMNNLTQAEKDRTNAEKKREEKVNNAVDDIEDALSGVDEAIENANNATDRANQAADNFDSLMKGNFEDVCVLKTEVGVANGVPSLDENAKVPLEQLPDEIKEKGGTGIYVSETEPEEIETSEHWFKIVDSLKSSDYDFLLDDEEITDTKTYTITYVLDGGKNSSSNPSSIKKSETVTLKNATKTGYTFNGWYSNSTFTTKVTTLSNVTTNITLYAKFTAINRSITYVLDGGTNSASNPSTITYSETVTLADATKDGYIFIGWYSDSEFTTKVETLSNVTKSVTLYAKFEECTVETTYLYNCGDECVDITGGWDIVTRYDEEDYNAGYFTYNMAKKSDHLYLKHESTSVWGLSKYLFYTKNIMNISNMYSRLGIEYEYTTTYESGNDLVNVGFISLDSWHGRMNPISMISDTSTTVKSQDFGTSNLNPKEPITDMNIGLRILGAIEHTQELKVYKIWLEKDVAEEEPELEEGYVYDDENNMVYVDTENGEEKVYVGDALDEKTYNITYVLDGGSNSENNPTFISSKDVIVLKEASLADYMFMGWYSDEDFINQVVRLENITSNITLYAKFTKNNMERIYLYDYGNECSNTTGGWTIDKTSKYSYDPSYVTFEKKTDCLYVKKELGKAASYFLRFNNTYNRQNHTTIYIKYKYTCNSDRDVTVCGSLDYTSSYANYGVLEQTEELKEVSFNSLDFSRDTESHPYLGLILTNGSNENSELFIYQIWMEIDHSEEYSLTFDVAGAEYAGASTGFEITYYDKLNVNKRCTPYKLQHRFLGWYREPEFLTKVTELTHVSSDLTLYAKFEEKITEFNKTITCDDVASYVTFQFNMMTNDYISSFKIINKTTNETLDLLPEIEKVLNGNTDYIFNKYPSIRGEMSSNKWCDTEIAPGYTRINYFEVPQKYFNDCYIQIEGSMQDKASMDYYTAESDRKSIIIVDNN